MIQEERDLQRIQEHYSPPNLSDTVLESLAAAGKDLDHLTIDDLAPLDEFHIRGRQATEDLAARLDLDGTEEVLDVGSGLGGPARYLASTYGCQVTGLDLTEEFCRTAQLLASLVGLEERVLFRQGSALDMPFEDAQFDVVWTQHAQMNIADKRRLYREIWRVLKPGGRFALYDILADDGGPVLFPVPWARTQDSSFLISPEDLSALLEEQGFRCLHWKDTSEEGRAFFDRMITKSQQTGKMPGLHVFLGPRFREMGDNVVRNLAERRIVVYEGVWVK